MKVRESTTLTSATEIDFSLMEEGLKFPSVIPLDAYAGVLESIPSFICTNSIG